MERTVRGDHAWKNGEEESVFDFARSRMSGEREVMASCKLGSPPTSRPKYGQTRAPAEDRVAVLPWMVPASAWRGSSALIFHHTRIWGLLGR